MTQQILVHPARPEQLKSIIFLERSVPGAPRWTEAMYRRYLQAETEETLQRRTLLVAEDDESRIKGFAVASLVADEAELESIAVAVSARRSGTGTALLSAVQSWAAEHAAQALLLEVRSSNQIARAFYAAHGFRPVGTRSAYYDGPVEDAVLLRLDINVRRPTT